LFEPSFHSAQGGTALKREEGKGATEHVEGKSKAMLQKCEIFVILCSMKRTGQTCSSNVARFDTWAAMQSADPTGRDMSGGVEGHSGLQKH
jgi:hypothetical protein